MVRNSQREFLQQTKTTNSCSEAWSLFGDLDHTSWADPMLMGNNSNLLPHDNGLIDKVSDLLLHLPFTDGSMA